jgi:HD-GYP domain-containing protein (c-di-GMP phosphodiesterase class II)
MITAFAKAIAAKDDYLAHHVENVKIYVSAIAKQLNVSAALTEQLATAATLHDLGKIIIPNHILRKNTALTDDERRIVERHPISSAEIIAPIGIFNQEAIIIRHHHENFDGTGYPSGLVGRNIPFGSRILAVANTFDAMTSKHWSVTPKSADDTIGEIVSLAGSQFDPEVVEAFKNAYAENHDKWPLSQKQQNECCA